MNQKTLLRLLAVACVLLLALDLGLALRVRQLVARVEALNHVVAAGERPALVEGAAFPRTTLLAPDGEPVPLIDVERHTGALLLVSSPSCDACPAVRATWQEAARLAEGSHVRVLELVLDAAPHDLPRGESPWPVVVSGDDRWSLVAGLPGLPAAVFVEGGGTVWRAFYGTDHTGLPQAVEQFLMR